MAERQGETAPEPSWAPPATTTSATPPLPPDAATAVAMPPVEVNVAEELPVGRRSLLRRKGFWWSVAAGIVVTGDAMLVSLTSGWRTEAADLQSRANDYGERIAIANGIDQAQQEQLSILTSQAEEVATTLSTLSTAADEEEFVAHAYRDVALDYQSCYDSRGEAIAKAWAGASVSTSLTEAKAACAAASKASAELKTGG